MVMNRQQRRSLERATAKTLAVGGDPAVAAELDELRRVRQGAYALMHVLVSRMGGTEAEPIRIARGDWQALPPLETLKVKIVRPPMTWRCTSSGELTIARQRVIQSYYI